MAIIRRTKTANEHIQHSQFVRFGESHARYRHNTTPMSESGETAIQNDNAEAERPSQQKRTLGNASIPHGYNCSVIRAREALYQSRDVRNTWVSDSVPTQNTKHTP